jgi:hypothetical protein
VAASIWERDIMGDAPSGNLWAITCYFNPMGYRRRLANYRVFRQHLAVPLVTVELSFDGRFQLQPEDADILKQLQGGAVLWQKERLLNVAVASLPEHCEQVAWVDCDIVFANKDWVDRASTALEEWPLVHLFHARHEIPRDTALDPFGSWEAYRTSQSAVYRIVAEKTAQEEVSIPGGLLARRSTNGLAWAGRRDVLEEHGLYDACIVGGGDRAILCAALGEFNRLALAREMNARRAEHYRAWARPFFDRIRGKVGYILGHVCHLWHGDLIDRRHGARHQQLAQFDFDPFTDIALAASGAWRWNSDKRDLHAFVQRYFESRNEDGV